MDCPLLILLLSPVAPFVAFLQAFAPPGPSIYLVTDPFIHFFPFPLDHLERKHEAERIKRYLEDGQTLIKAVAAKQKEMAAASRGGGEMDEAKEEATITRAAAGLIEREPKEIVIPGGEGEECLRPERKFIHDANTQVGE